jgi:NAD(P)-dependent dehydrogenase (short-subunit alcohol dehydrogenase family)
VSSENLFNLKDQVVILIGATGLLGRQYSESLSEAGANVVIADLNFSDCKKFESTLRKKFDVNPLSVKVDITKKKSITEMVKKVMKYYSKIDVLINNAIFPEGSKERSTGFENFSLSVWNKVLSVNLTGVFLCCQEVGKVMVRQKHGNIINVSSIYGLTGADQRIYGKSKLNSSPAYAVTKSGILNLTRYLASYWSDQGIRVNTLSLGGVKNNQDSLFIKNYSYKTMVGRMANKNDYSGSILFLASNASLYMTGSNLVVDGGWTAW